MLGLVLRARTTKDNAIYLNRRVESAAEVFLQIAVICRGTRQLPTTGEIKRGRDGETDNQGGEVKVYDDDKDGTLFAVRIYFFADFQPARARARHIVPTFHTTIPINESPSYVVNVLKVGFPNLFDVAVVGFFVAGVFCFGF